jgi:hypothetical protein
LRTVGADDEPHGKNSRAWESCFPLTGGSLVKNAIDG